MPAGRLDISFDELRTKGQTLISRSEGLQAQLDEISTIAQPDGIWDGAAAASYKDEYDRWSAAQRTMIVSLRSMGEFLINAANAYEGVDDEVRRALGLS